MPTTNRLPELTKYLVKMPNVVSDNTLNVSEVTFIKSIIENIKNRKNTLTQKQLNEYLYQVYLGVETRTGICLWHYDDDFCRHNFKPDVGAEDTLIWIADLINSVSTCSSFLEHALKNDRSFENLPWTKQDLEALAKVYYGCFNPYSLLREYEDAGFLTEF